MDLCWQSNVSVFEYTIQVGHNLVWSDSFFACGHLVVLGAFAPLCCLFFFVRDQLTIFIWVCLGESIFYLIDILLFFFFYEDHIFLIPVASVLNLEDGQPQSSNIVILC